MTLSLFLQAGGGVAIFYYNGLAVKEGRKEEISYLCLSSAIGLLGIMSFLPPYTQTTCAWFDSYVPSHPDRTCCLLHLTLPCLLPLYMPCFQFPLDQTDIQAVAYPLGRDLATTQLRQFLPPCTYQFLAGLGQTRFGLLLSHCSPSILSSLPLFLTRLSLPSSSCLSLSSSYLSSYASRPIIPTKWGFACMLAWPFGHLAFWLWHDIGHS